MLVSEGSEGGGLGQTQVKASQGVPRGGFPWISSSLGGGDSGPSGEGRAPVMETPRFWGTEGSWSALLLTASWLILAQNSQWASWDRRGQRPGPHEPEPRSHGVLLRTRGRGAARLAGVPRRAPVASPLARTAWHRRERGGGPAGRQGPDGPHSRPRLPVGDRGPGPSLRTARHRQRPHVPTHRGRRVPLGLGAPRSPWKGRPCISRQRTG